MVDEEIKHEPTSKEDVAETSQPDEGQKEESKEQELRPEPETFRELYTETLKTLEEGQILQGTVIDITPDHVTVDVGYKCEGQIPIKEFVRRNQKVDVKVGERIDVLLEKKGSEEGLLVLSKEKADKVTIWRDISRSCREGEVIEGEIVAKVKGGLSVELGGAVAFLPGSQIDLKPVRDLDALIGSRLKFKVIKFNRKRNNIVLSRRILLEEERKALREETLKNLQEEAVVEGTVKNLTDYGAFVDLGGLDGLLHITDIAYGRISHPSDKLSVEADASGPLGVCARKISGRIPDHGKDRQHDGLRRFRRTGGGGGRPRPHFRDELGEEDETSLQGRPCGRSCGRHCPRL
jgi:small subunit ribosomal protein S1